MRIRNLAIFSCSVLAVAAMGGAAVLPTAIEGVSLALSSLPGDTPMGIAYVPSFARYYEGDGGYPGSPARVWSAAGVSLGTANPGVDNRGVYYNSNTGLLESVSFNACCGTSSITGIQSLTLDGTGNLTGANTQLLAGPIAALGDDQTMPSYDPAANRLYAKQQSSGNVNVVNRADGSSISTIVLDLASAGVTAGDVNSEFVGFTGSAGEELAILDFTNRRVLVFNLSGSYVGASALPGTLTVDDQNEDYGCGYANGWFFVFDSAVGANGSYRSFQILQGAGGGAAIPTLSLLGLALLGLLVATGGLLALRRVA